MTALAITAPAKLNLHLQVLGQRSDGFHELRTLLCSIDLCDELAASPRDDGHLELQVEPAGQVPADERNLVLAAAALLRQRCAHQRGATLSLLKRIPVGAGLGGGSADAAAALVLLDRLWQTGLDAEELHQLAARLGSDVPFFLHGGLALGVGRGEEVYPLADLAPLGVIIAVPELSISTAEVYRRCSELRPDPLTWSPPDATLYGFSAGLRTELPWSSLYNDLQQVVVAGWPEVGVLRQQLQDRRPLLAAVTGSGSAVFAIFRSRQEAAAAAAGIAGRLHVGSTLGRAHARLLEPQRPSQQAVPAARPHRSEGSTEDGDNRGPHQPLQGWTGSCVCQHRDR